MYRITAINNESDPEEEDETKVTKEAEVCSHNLNNNSLIIYNFFGFLVNFDKFMQIFG